MGWHSSDSDGSRSSRHRRSKRSPKRSSRGRSRSYSPKRCKKKLKKYKKSNRSLSRETRRRHSSDRKSRHRHRSSSRSNSPNDRRRKQSKDSERDRRSKDDYKKSKSRRRHRSSSSSSSTSSSSSSSSKSKSATPKRRFDYDPDELLEKLNKAAVEAMAANKKIKPDPLSTIEMQIKRQDMINELRGTNSIGLSDFQVGTPLSNLLPPPAPLLSAKLNDILPVDDAPVIVDLNTPSFSTTSVSNTNSESLLHPNLLLENQDEKLNRWVKKLHQLRQRAMIEEAASNQIYDIK